MRSLSALGPRTAGPASNRASKGSLQTTKRRKCEAGSRYRSILRISSSRPGRAVRADPGRFSDMCVSVRDQLFGRCCAGGRVRSPYCMRVKVVAMTLIAALVVVACSEGASEPTSSTPPDFGECEQPPNSEKEPQNPEYVLNIAPNPASSGDAAGLTIEPIDDGGNSDGVETVSTGSAALFQCWDGSGWTDI